MKTTLTTLGISLLVLAGCAGQKQTANDFIQENIDNAVRVVLIIRVFFVYFLYFFL